MMAHVVMALASGVLLALAFPSPSVSLCAWIALVPFFWMIAGASIGRAFRLGWLAGFVFSLGTLYWLVNPIRYYTDAPLALAVLALLLGAAFVGAHIGGFAAALRLAQTGDRVSLALAAPVIWVSMEWVRSVGPLAFPWVALGYSQYRQHDLIQFAEVTGVHGVSALVVFGNAVVYAVLRERHHVMTRQGWALALFVLLIIGLPIAGRARVAALRNAPAKGTLQVGVVQGNVNQAQKWDPAFQQAALERYAQLTMEAAEEGARLVVWPETAVPFYFQSEGPARQALVDFASTVGVQLLFGSPAYAAADGRMQLFNRAYLVHDDGSVGAFYDKLQLVPFGEYVPLPQLLFFVDKIVEGVGHFQAGEVSTVFNLPEGRFGVLICYEGIFPRLSRQLVDRGADFLINITNDAWFGDTSAPHQHLAMVTLRAIENRVPVVRAANTGISAIVDVDGRIRWQTGLFEATARTDAIMWPGVRSVYSQYGEVFMALCGFASIGLIGYGGVRRWRPAR